MSSLVSRFPMDRDPLRPPPAPGLGRGVVFALIAHGLLVLALSLGVSWRSAPIPAAEAELWASVPVAAAPKEQLPPEESPPPRPEPQPEPPKPQQPTPEEVQAQRDAEIAIAKAKERKLKEEQEQREAEDKKRKLEQQKKDEAEKQDRLERDRKEKEAQAKKDKAEQADKAKAEKARKDAEARAEQARQENLKRIMGMAGATGAPNATGTAQKSAGPSANYAGRIKARVKPNIVYADPGGAANPEAEVEVRCSPDGTIIARRIVKSSGLPDYDAAVLRALDKTEVLPRDTDGTVPRVMVITFRPRE
jgi:colicin import membrane protein